MTANHDIEDKVRKRIDYAYWVWLVGSIVAVVSAALSVVVAPDPDSRTVTLVFAVGNAVLAAIAVPAALALRRRRNWARITLFVLSLLCIGGAAQALRIGAWPALLLNVVLASPIAVLAGKDVKAACKGKAATSPSGAAAPAD